MKEEKEEENTQDHPLLLDDDKNHFCGGSLGNGWFFAILLLDRGVSEKRLLAFR